MSKEDGKRSEAQERAMQDAFEKGQQAWREGKGCEDYPYPPAASDYIDYWQQGWESENSIHND